MTLLSSNSRSAGVTFSLPQKRTASAQANLNATPEPERPPKGYECPGSRGWTNAAASGNRSLGSW